MNKLTYFKAGIKSLNYTRNTIFNKVSSNFYVPIWDIYTKDRPDPTHPNSQYCLTENIIL